jgi:putative MATE family efflux protein
VSKTHTKKEIVFEGEITPNRLRKQVWSLAWPTIGEQCLNLLVGLSDVFFVGHLTATAVNQLGYGSAEALTSAALATFFTWVSFVIFSAVSIPATTLVARAYGAHDIKHAAHIGRQALVVGLITGIIVAIILHFSASYLILAFGASGNVAQIGTIYLETAALGMPLWALLTIGNACLRGSGDTRTPLLIMLLVNSINIVGSALLVNGTLGFPIMGIRGAAMAAATAWTVGGLAVAIRLYKAPRLRNTGALYIPFGVKFEATTILAMLKIGLPTLGEQLAFQFGIFFFARMVVGLGTTNYAAHNAIISIDSIAFLPGMGFGIAATVLVGQCLGANRPDLAERYATTSYQLGLVFMTFMGITFVLFPQFFLSILVNDPNVIEAASNPLRIAGMFDPLLATVFIFIGVLRGAGDTRYPMYARIISSCGVRFILGYIFIELIGLGLYGVRLAMGLDSVVLSIMVVWRFKSGRWKSAIKDESEQLQEFSLPQLATIQSSANE